jgi:hypothetical protein
MLKLTVLDLGRVYTCIELPSSLSGVLGDTESFDFATGHLMLNIGAVGIFDSLHAE